MPRDFADRVVLVTGAGTGLGRAHALGFAKAGATVIVNDIDSPAARAAADETVDRIVADGGRAVAELASVTNAAAVQAMVDRTIDGFGRIDCVVNNAGILRDSSFQKMSAAEWQEVIDVHVNGAMNVTHAVWPHMRTAGYGRIVMTTSSSGLFGNFGQVNYGAAKMAQVGMMTSLAIEGRKHGIHVNAIAPVAWTDMTAALLPPAAETLFTAGHVTPGVLFLAGEAAPTGMILSAGGGAYAAVRIVESEAVFLGAEAGPDAIAAAFGTISDPATARPFDAGPTQTAALFSAVMKGLAGASDQSSN